MIVPETIFVAFSMFSAIPMPKVEWNARNMKYSLIAFPLVGAVIGLIMWAVFALCGLANLPALLRAALFSIIPVLVTGGIHIDGFADTIDALASHAEPAKKQEILKDPHVGSFAVIRICCYFVLLFALWSTLPSYRPLPILITFVLSRTMSGFAIASFPLAKDTGLAHAFASAADKKKVSTILMILAVVLTVLLCLSDTCGIFMAVTAWIVFRYYLGMSKKKFGGISGDLAGWFLIRVEEWTLIALFAAEYLEVLFR